MRSLPALKSPLGTINHFPNTPLAFVRRRRLRQIHDRKIIFLISSKAKQKLFPSHPLMVCRRDTAHFPPGSTVHRKYRTKYLVSLVSFFFHASQRTKQLELICHTTANRFYFALVGFRFAGQNTASAIFSPFLFPKKSRPGGKLGNSQPKQFVLLYIFSPPGGSQTHMEDDGFLMVTTCFRQSSLLL